MGPIPTQENAPRYRRAREYLGLVLFGAQQFRSQVHRRVVGNSGTALFGRMDPDELSTPGYAVLSPATRTKLATLEKGQLMVRHPHFTQPIFRSLSAPLRHAGPGRRGTLPQNSDVPIESSILRALRLSIRPSRSRVQDITAFTLSRKFCARVT